MFEPFEDDQQAKVVLNLILDEYLDNTIEMEANPIKLASLRIVDVLVSVRNYYWDDQRDCGARKDDILAVNKLFMWMGYPELCDNFWEWANLLSDEATIEKYS